MNYLSVTAPSSARNKGIICKDYFSTKQCVHVNCPYAHIADGEEHPIPQATCLFFQQNKCLREDCKFFHGSKQEHAKLKASGKTTYRPQDTMLIATPPTEAPKPVIIPLMTPHTHSLPPPQPPVAYQPQAPLMMYQQPQPFMQMPLYMNVQTATPPLIVSNGQYFTVQHPDFVQEQQPVTYYLCSV